MQYRDMTKTVMAIRERRKDNYLCGTTEEASGLFRHQAPVTGLSPGLPKEKATSLLTFASSKR